MNEYHEILIQCDQKNHWEFPPSSAIGTDFKELEQIKISLDKIFEITLDFDRNVQDASFMTDIGELNEKYYNRETGTGAIIYKYGFRFSNFGRLYSIVENGKSELEITNKIEKAKKLLKQEGFVFIPKEHLEFEYDGVNEPFEKGLTWWTRYFDYL